jgi:hypothetical protein
MQERLSKKRERSACVETFMRVSEASLLCLLKTELSFLAIVPKIVNESLWSSLEYLLKNLVST